MVKNKKIRVGRKYVEAIAMKLGNKNLIVLKGSKGYVMCGYLNLSVADKFKDAAIRITGVSTIAEALKAKVNSRTSYASKLGVYKGQQIKDTLSIIV